MQWHEVTWYSKLGALLLFVLVVPVLAFYTGTKYNELQAVKKLIVAPHPEAPRVAGTAADAETQTIRLFLYDPLRDTDASGNVLCSEKGLVAVERTVPGSAEPLRAALELLLTGDLLGEEHARGITTQFPLEGVALVRATVEGGIATIELADPNSRTSGGACHASVTRAQVERTAQLIPGVTRVEFVPDTLFQP